MDLDKFIFQPPIPNSGIGTTKESAMRNFMIGAAAVISVASAFAAPAAQASEGRGGKPFITATHYQKNISLAEFRTNPRSYFVSEEAFRLIVKFVGDEMGQTLTAAQFVALVRSDQVRVRACASGESINTGALSGNQFHWFVRSCRSGEQILQVNGKDLISLNCLNAVEDQTSVPPPSLTAYVPPAPPTLFASPSQVIVTYREGFSVAGGTYSSGCCGCVQIYSIQGVSIQGSSSKQIIF